MKHLTLLLCLFATVLNAQIKYNYDSIPSITPAHPINSFLSAPITSFSIRSISIGCVHYLQDSLNFGPLNDSIFKGKAISIGRKKKRVYPSTQANIHLLNSILHNINENSNAVPGIRDFAISKTDKENFKKLIDFGDKKYEYHREQTMEKAAYYATLEALDSIDSSLLSRVIEKPEQGWGPDSHFFIISIVNASNDTINISHNYSFEKKSWNLPWNIEYKSLRFRSSSIQLSKFINSCIPDGFMGKELFDNKILIRQIADYMYGSDK